MPVDLGDAVVDVVECDEERLVDSMPVFGVKNDGGEVAKGMERRLVSGNCLAEAIEGKKRSKKKKKDRNVLRGTGLEER